MMRFENPFGIMAKGEVKRMKKYLKHVISLFIVFVAISAIFLDVSYADTSKQNAYNIVSTKEPVVLDDIEVKLLEEQKKNLMSENDLLNKIKNPEVSKEIRDYLSKEYQGANIEFKIVDKFLNFAENGAINLEVIYDVVVNGERKETFRDYVQVAPNIANSKKVYKAGRKPVTEESIKEALERRRINIAENKKLEESYKYMTEDEKYEALLKQIRINNIVRVVKWILIALFVFILFVMAVKKDIVNIRKYNLVKLIRVLVLIIVVLAVTIGQSVTLADHIWRYNYQRTGYVIEQMVLPYKLVKTITDFGASGSTPIIIGDDELYVTDNATQTMGRIHLEGASSNTVWKVGTFNGDWNNGVVYGGYYVLANDNILEVRSRSNGNRVYSATMSGSSVNDPLIIGNYVYITTIAGYIERYTLPNLTNKRSYEVYKFSGHTTSVRCAPTYISDTRIAIVSSAVRSSDGNREGEIIVLNQDLGLVGKQQMIAGAIATPVYVGGKLYVHDYRGHVYRANTSGTIESTRRRPHDGISGANYYTAQSSGASDGSYYYWPIKTSSSGYTAETGIFKIPLNFTASTAITAYKKGTWPTSSLTISKTNYGDTIFYMTNDGYLRAIYASNGNNNTNAFTNGQWSIYVSGVGDFSSPVINGGVGGYIVLMSGGGVRIFSTDDSTAPEITANPASNNWTKDNISVTLTVTDKGNSAIVGVYRIWTVINTNSTTPAIDSTGWGNPKYSFSLFKSSQQWTETISSQGIYYIHVKASDRLGNTSIKTFGPYRIDKTVPAISFNPNSSSWTKSDVSVTITASDSGGSGVKEFYYALSSDGGSTWSGWTKVTGTSTTVNLTTEGNNKIKAYSVDNAGNTGSTETSGSYLIDKTSPGHVSDTISGYRYASGSSYWVRPNDIITVRDRGSDALSGIISQYLRFYGNGVDRRVFHRWDGAADEIRTWSPYDDPTHVEVISVSRTYNSGNQKEVTWQAKPKTDGHFYDVMCYYYDLAGNGYGYFSVGKLGVDGTAPTVTIMPNSQSWTNSNITITISASDTGGSGVKRIEYMISSDNGATWPGSWTQVSGSSTTVTLSNTGQYKIRARAVDNVDNISNYIEAGTYQIDKEAPNPPTITLSTENWTNQNVTVTITSGTDAHSGVNRTEYRINGGTWTTYTSNFTISTEGITTIEARTIDNAGNTSSTASKQAKIDKTAPTAPTISINPSSWTSGTATVTITPGTDSLSGVDKTEYRINGGSWQVYSSSFTISAEGITTIEARTIDKAGNSSTISSAQAKIDKTNPTISANPTTRDWGNTNVTVTLTYNDTGGSGLSSIQYAWSTKTTEPTWDTTLHSDAILVNNWSSGFNSGVNNPEIGYHAKWVYEGIGGASDPCMKFIDRNDLYGLGHRWLGISQNLGTPSSLGWNVGDSITISWYQKSDVLNKGARVGLYHKLKSSGSYSFGTNVQTINVTKVGQWERVSFTTVIDSDWDLTASVSLYVYGYFGDYGTLWVDNIQVEKGIVATAFTTGSPNVVKNADGKSILNGTPGSYVPTFWSNYTGSVTQSNEGVWYLHAKAVDTAGNTYTTYFGPYKIDKTLPAVTFNPNSCGWNKSVTITVSPSDNGGSGIKQWRYAISKDNGVTYGAWSNYFTGNTNITLNTSGVYQIKVEVTDNAGNTATIYSGIYNIDSDVPTITVNPTSSNWINTDIAVTVSYNDNGGSGFKYRQYKWSTSTTKPTSWDNYTSGNLTQISEGTWYLHLQAEDNAGNYVYRYSGPYRIDKTPPTAPAVNVNPSSWTNGTVTISISPGTDNLSGVNRTEYRINEGAWQVYSSSFTVSAEGITTIEARTIDNAGNISSVSSAQARIDKIAPIITANPATRDWSNANVTVTLTYNDSGGSGLSVRQYAWSTSTTIPATWNNYSGSVTQSSEGVWYLHAKAVDSAGNTYTTYFGPYKIDKTAPTITANPTSRDWSNANVTVTLTYNDSGGSGLSLKQYAWSTSTTTPSSWNNYSSAVTQTANGIWYLHAKATDTAGNVYTTYFGPYKIDKLAPNPSIVKLEAISSTSIKIYASATDPQPGSGLHAQPYRYYRNGNLIMDWMSYSTFTDSGLSPNTRYTYTIQARDAVGNISGQSSGLSIYTLANQPSNINTTFDGANIIITWSHNGNPSYTKYEIEYSDGTVTNNVVTTGTSYTIQNVTIDKRYRLRMRAINEDGIPTDYTQYMQVNMFDVKGFKITNIRDIRWENYAGFPIVESELPIIEKNGLKIGLGYGIDFEIETQGFGATNDKVFIDVSFSDIYGNPLQLYIPNVYGFLDSLDYMDMYRGTSFTKVVLTASNRTLKDSQNKIYAWKGYYYLPFTVATDNYTLPEYVMVKFNIKAVKETGETVYYNKVSRVFAYITTRTAYDDIFLNRFR
jgi:hypothetical protein